MAFTPDQLRAISHLLDEALSLPAPDCQRWLSVLPAEHAGLAPALKRVLASRLADQDPSFLNSGPRLSEAVPVDSIASAGTLVGPYRLISELGRGGMGTVWLAERVQDGLKRKVALKLPRLAWGPGLADRMARERDIGALLEHPGIARLYEAGLDEHGRPYLAFEHVDGQPIDQWCEQNRLGVRDRLALLVELVRAVEYAHGRLVVHRDIKPTNVLVSKDGRVHLLDFGIGKLLDEAHAAAGAVTVEHGTALTPRYASPEQLAGQAMTVQSDIFSIGALAYELLCGQLPYPTRGDSWVRHDSSASMECACLASSLTTDRSLARSLRGAVDAVLNKAVERRLDHRYPTAAAMADDIERFLSGQRVLAQPDRLAYRLSRLVRRHPAVAGVAVSTMIASLIGVVLLSLQVRRTAEALDQARAVKEFIVEIFKANSRDGPQFVKLREVPTSELLLLGAQRIEQKFANDPETRLELHGLVSELLTDIGATQEAEQQALKRLDLLDRLNGHAAARFDALLALSNVYAMQQKAAEAVEASTRALQAAESLGDHERMLQARLVLLDALGYAGRFEEVRRQLDLADAEIAKTHQQDSMNAATALYLRADMESSYRNPVSIDMQRRAVEMAARFAGPRDSRTLNMRRFLVQTLSIFRQYEECRQVAEALFRDLRATRGDDDLWANLWEMEMLALDLSSPEAGIPYEDLERRLQGLHGVVRGGRDGQSAYVQGEAAYLLASFYVRRENVTEARRYLPKAEAWFPHVSNPAMSSGHIANLIGALELQGRFDEALILMKQRWDPRDRSFDLAAARVLRQAGRFDEAHAALGRAEAHRRSKKQQVVSERIHLLVDQGRCEEALQMLQSPDTRLGFLSDAWRGHCLCATGDLLSGEPLLARAETSAGSIMFSGSPLLARIRTLHGQCAPKIGDKLPGAARR